jgi:SRSO17 transposase
MTAGVKRHDLGCVGKVANGITTVHLSYVPERTGHALIGARQWIPAGQIEDPVQSVVMGLPPDLVFRTKGQLAIDILTETLTGGVTLDFVCGDEVYGACTELREFLEARGQGYALRVPFTFRLTLARQVTMTCAQAVTRLLAGSHRWEVRSAGAGSKGQRWYAWALLATASPRHYLLVRRHLGNGELAFCYCFVPKGERVSMARLGRAAGLRWPVEEDFEFSKDCFGLDQSQVRLYRAIARHTVLVMAALAISAVTAALLRHRTDTQAAAPTHPDQPPPAGPGMTPLTVPEITRLLTTQPARPGLAELWANWRRGHQARSRWYHQRIRLARATETAPLSQAKDGHRTTGHPWP